MKIVSKIVLFISMALGISGVAAASESSEYPWVYEAFENSSLGKVEADGATLSLLEEGANGSNGALKVTVGSNIMNGGGGYKISTNLKNGSTYKLSFLIRLEANANIPRAGSANNAYNSNGAIAKLYGVIREGTSLKETLDFGDATYWSNEDYILIEKEFTYGYDGTGANISFRVGERTDRGGMKLQGGANLVYYLDEVKLIPVSETEIVSNLNYAYVENESNMLQISYDFSGTNDNSLCVFKIESEGKWVTLKAISTGESVCSFQIPTDANGKNCKVVVYPADGTTAGIISEKTIENLRMNVLEELIMSADKVTANVTLCYPNLKTVMVIICQYSEENEMVDIIYQKVDCNNNEEKQVSVEAEIKENTESASLLIWEGSDFKTSNMVSLVEEKAVKKQ